jgi:hypothetical protein
VDSALVENVIKRDGRLRRTIDSGAGTDSLTRDCPADLEQVLQAFTTMTFTSSARKSFLFRRLDYGTRGESVAPGIGWKQEFAVVPSFAKPFLLIPLGNAQCVKNGLQLYLPYARRARLLKTVLSTILQNSKMHFLHPILGMESPQRLAIQDLVSQITGEHDPIFAMRIGTPGRYQKLTLNAMRPNGELLGYIKLPLTPDASDRVRHEATVLRRLAEYPKLRPHLPQCLYDGLLGENYVLFQSVLSGSAGPAILSSAHRRFLALASGIHRVSKPGKRVVEEVGAKFDSVAGGLDSKWKALGRVILNRTAGFFNGKNVICGAGHGDFAPWNTQLDTHGKLLVHDWESMEWECLPSWDLMHFDFQVRALLNIHQPDDILRTTGANASSMAAELLLFILRTFTRIADEGNRSNYRLFALLQNMAEEALRNS